MLQVFKKKDSQINYNEEFAQVSAFYLSTFGVYGVKIEQKKQNTHLYHSNENESFNVQFHFD